MTHFDLIRQWATDRNLIEGSTPQAQMLKTIEEIGETASAIARKQTDLIADGIGDVVVTLVILAAQYGINIEDCIALAWEEIKDRKGRMVDGIFIKQEEKNGN